MSKIGVSLMLLGLTLGSVATAEATKRPKVKFPYTVERTYARPAVGIGGVGVTTDGVYLPAFPRPTRLSIEIEDNASDVGHISLTWDSDGDGTEDQSVTVCGQTDDPISVPANREFRVYAWAMPGTGCLHGLSTQGTVRATFRR